MPHTLDKLPDPGPVPSFGTHLSYHRTPPRVLTVIYRFPPPLWGERVGFVAPQEGFVMDGICNAERSSDWLGREVGRRVLKWVAGVAELTPPSTRLNRKLMRPICILSPTRTTRVSL